MKYCPHCREIVELDHKHDTRKDSTVRGYDSSWEKFSRKFRRANPSCKDCKAKGLERACKEVHIDKKWGDSVTRHKFHRDKAEQLCLACHRERTKKGE